MALPQDAPADAYLRQLADAAEQWFNKRPDEPIELARRILQFRQGCSTLILSPHRPLSPANQTWLNDKCQAWAEKFDSYLITLEFGAPVSQVRDAADATVRRLIGALREKAAEV